MPSPVISLPSSVALPATGFSGAEERLGQFGLAVALHARDREDLPCLHLEGHVVELHDAEFIDDGQILYGEHDLARRGGSLVDLHGDRAPHHERRQFLLRRGGLRGANDLPAANNRDGVRDGLHFAQLVGDEHNGGARLAQLAHDLKQLVSLLRGQHRGGLVKNEHLGALRQRLDDFNPLLGAHGQVFHNRVGIHVEPKASRNLAHLLARRIDVEQFERSAHLLVAEHDVLRHSERVHEHEVLVHHRDTGRHGVAGASELDRLVVDGDVALVWVIQPKEHIHERRLARAVLAEQRVHGSGLDDQVYRVIGGEIAKTLGNSPKFEFHVCSFATARTLLVKH